MADFAPSIFRMSAETLTGAEGGFIAADGCPAASGAEMLAGGRGEDALRGDAGADTTAHGDAFGQDTLAGSTDGPETIGFRGHSRLNAIDTLSSPSSGDDAVVSDGPGNSVPTSGATFRRAATCHPHP